MAIARSLVILGAHGDLTSRLLLPGVGALLASERAPSIELIGVDRDESTPGGWRTLVETAFEAGGAPPERVRDVLASTRYLRADVTDEADLQRVLAACSAPPALYFALPPAVTVAACETLARMGVPDDLVLALEKPFGVDRASAASLNALLARIVPEQSVQRVDHFLGKSTVLNLLGLRFGNRLIERVWNADDIESVEITYDESLGLEHRAGYYDRAGAFVDMVQSHLLLVLALVAMEPPSSLDADDLRGAMAQALRAVRVAPGRTRRARYTAGRIGERDFPSYVDEPGVEPERGTETLAEAVVTVDNWRWAGVPFTLRSGKALGEARKQIVVTFREVPHLPAEFEGSPGPSRLTIALNPEELELDLTVNGQGNPFDLERTTLRAALSRGELSAYGEVLHGILTGDPLLSVRGDIAEECWRITDEVLAQWRSGSVPLEEYPAGSAGPATWSQSAAERP